jgi:hypothetical protein
MWISLEAFLTRADFDYIVPVRTFKTKRDVQAANERNPSLMSRVKDKFFPASKGAEGAAASGTTPASSDKLKGTHYPIE